MSFQLPRNIPNFSDGIRKVENITWQGFKGGSDLPLYKDKPWASPLRRPRFYRRKRSYLILLLLTSIVLFFRPWVTIASRARRLQPPQKVVYGDSWEDRREQIRQSFVSSWDAYSRDAWGMDEYHPLTSSGRNMVQDGMGWIIVDALDTLMIMNLTTQLEAAREWVDTKLSYDKDHNVNVFETTIRMLGGLLSAHYLSKDDLYLEKATDLGNRLVGAYDSASGIPYASVNLQTGQGEPSHVDGGASSTSEATTVQLEMKYLSKLTGEAIYWKKAEKVIQVVEGNKAEAGLLPIFVHPTTGAFRGSEIRLGSRGDSYYEYLLKQYLQTNKKEIVYKDMYAEAMLGVRKHLLKYSNPNKLAFIAELPQGIGGPLSPKMDHLVCFMGGNLALGATEGKTAVQAKSRGWTGQMEMDLLLGGQITESCFQMYNTTATGLAPEIVYFNMEQDDATEDMSINERDAHNLQRPETIESLFVMWRITGDPKYREWGWQIFQAFEKWTKLESGAYASVSDVTRIPPPPRNNMESFWLAETLKYLYLLFSPIDLLPLTDVVFNTEAHPLPRFDMEPLFQTGWARKTDDVKSTT